MASERTGAILVFKIFLYRNIPYGVYLRQQIDDHNDKEMV